MAPREDLVSSAVNFLRDPSVASSPLEKRIEFLQSKNLTQEEIDLSLSQAAGAPSQAPIPSSAPYYPQQAYQGPPPGYNGYPPYGQWQQPPPELPRRDWRDWFIMATVLGGAGYGVYALAQRYIKPLIAPPTPPQLEQDKAAIDEQFNRAFALLDTLASDTTALKEAEEARTKKLDAAIMDVENIVKELKAASTKREDDARRIEAEVKGMKDSLPRAIDSVKEGSERQLKELSTELASLKMLMGNRMGSGNSNASMFSPTGSMPTARPQADNITRSTTATSATEIAPGSKSNVTGVNNSSTTPSFATPASSFPSSNSSTAPASSTGIKSFSNSAGKAASIPAWQMAAQKQKDTPANGVGGSSTPQDGADVVAMLNAS